MTDRTSHAFRAAEAIVEALYPEDPKNILAQDLVASIIDLHFPGYLRGSDLQPPHISKAVLDGWAREHAKGDNRLYHFLKDKFSDAQLKEFKG